jgi:hypothetical protein
MEDILSSRQTQIDRMMLQTMTAVFTIFTFLPTSAFAGLDGINWHSEQDYISAHGRLELTSNHKFCTFIDKLECKVREPGKLPIYYLLECDRNRRICEAVSAKLLRGEPWLVKTRISDYRMGYRARVCNHEGSSVPMFGSGTANRFGWSRGGFHGNLHKEHRK